MALRRLPGRRHWTWQATINGKVVLRSTRETEKAKALQHVPRLEEWARLQRGQRTGFPDLLQAVTSLTQKVEDETSAGRALRVSTSLTNFVKFTGNVDLRAINTDMLDAYQRHRLKSVAEATVRDELTTVLRLLRENGLNVIAPRYLPGTRTQQRAFTNDELNRFFRACPDLRRPLYATLLVTGARLAELVPSGRSTHQPLLKTEVEADLSRIVLRCAKRRRNARPNVRIIPIPADVLSMLQTHMQSLPDPFVFEPQANGPRDFDVILKNAEIEKVDPLGRKVTQHAFRHTYATMMAATLGGNAFMLKAIMGHAKISTTERYCHPEAPALSLDLTGLELREMN